LLPAVAFRVSVGGVRLVVVAPENGCCRTCVW
jgi:hypothetical protein